jgi:hypothetical protein
MNKEEQKPASGGITAPQQGETNERTPRAPHERDESADSQQGREPSQGRMADIGRRDVESGRTDTDKGPVLRDLHEKKLKP